MYVCNQFYKVIAYCIGFKLDEGTLIVTANYVQGNYQ